MAGTIDGQLKADQLTASAFAKAKQGPTKPGECGSTGARTMLAEVVHAIRQGNVMLGRAGNLLRPSERSGVPPFMVMDVVAAAARLEAQGRRIIHMEVGQPAAGAPATAIAPRVMRSPGPLGYTETLGTDRCDGESRWPTANGTAIDLDPARIVVTTGSSAGFILAFLAAFEAGDRVAIALPGYPPYRHILAALGCEPVGIETTASARWSLTGEACSRCIARESSKASSWPRLPIQPAP